VDDHDIAHFDRWSSRYDRSILQRLFFGPVQEATIAEAARESGAVHAVLDVGCGTGQLLRRLAGRYLDAELVGVDPSAGMVTQAHRISVPDRHVAFLSAGAEKLPFPDAHFDLVVTTVSFHHWADQQQGLREIRRVVRDTGLFVLTDGLADGLLRWPFLFNRNHGRLPTPESLDAMLVAQRFHTLRRCRCPGGGR